MAAIVRFATASACFWTVPHWQTWSGFPDIAACERAMPEKRDELQSLGCASVKLYCNGTPDKTQ